MHLEILIYASSFNIGLTTAPGGALSGPKWDKKRVKLPPLHFMKQQIAYDSHINHISLFLSLTMTIKRIVIIDIMVVAVHRGGGGGGDGCGGRSCWLQWQSNGGIVTVAVALVVARQWWWLQLW